ncbi:flagellar basal body P-ring protein FlgI [Candidatus Liberibacter asiaticus]|uniref:Flagellar P-ring protein n=2 Tax=Liberibacter asiaticus TaxID=34021 RepID=C6XHV6_LIBAP|nr:flagellar basal body P-ring protein FlgI [Candidatus Liberibacter asiaticus]ACT56849.1 flagellar basal body P-ring protein [Candidatus Liberibacter asiaticus str. psy62]AGH16613.1 flagellar basal body P-ring protein [Candidatus Liberibacter asiaticus str. gxpsy]ALK07004.1 flagellar basal body P-ring protein FlgI [Candidatus Liberibacter asiaticus]ASK52475.1 flagellar biosynthesis protein FlgI [Candidatus Liberibacter asiaticus]AWL13799.1 flagellar basal body P-ring protein FlgI [Candidatus 
MIFRIAFLIFSLIGLHEISAQVVSRIKDVVSLQSGRDNQLIGYGLVVGLQGTGDSLRSSPFTEQSMRSLLQNLGISTPGGRLGSKNVAAVMVTANLPPFASPGSRIDVSINSLGDASSLRGGILVMTSLLGADGNIYAVAQGSVVVSGLFVKGQSSSFMEGISTGGKIVNGAIVERELPKKFKDSADLILQLRNPDFSTAIRIADQINSYSLNRFSRPIAEAYDSRTVKVSKPTNIDLTRLMSEVEMLTVETDTPARVIINERTGTIVIGDNVRISKVVVSYGNLTVQITENEQVVQPNAFSSNGSTVTQNNTDLKVSDNKGSFSLIDAPDLNSLISGMNSIGLKTDGIISILQGIKAAGALQSEIIIQ